MRFLLLPLLLLSSCQDYNSNSGDRGKYGEVVLNETDPNFRDAYYIIQNRCVSCHDHEHDDWAELKSNDDWIAEGGLITPGQPENSLLLRRIINSAQVGANMPPGGSAIPDDEYEHLEKWITEFP